MRFSVKKIVENFSAFMVVNVVFFASLAPALANEGLPQLDPSSFSSQIFWMLVFFILLYLLMAHLALPRISKTLETRHTKITSDLEAARSLRDEAEKIRESYEASLQDSHARVRDLMNETQLKISQKAQEDNQRLSEQLNEQIAEAEKKIEAAREKAMEGIQEASTLVALELANKFGSIIVNDNDAASAVKNQVKKKG